MGDFVKYNPNPLRARVGDCTVRAISKALEQDWEKTYIGIVLEGFLLADMPSANHVWGSYLQKHGFCRKPVFDGDKKDYTVAAFCREHPEGVYILALDGHVVCVSDGDWFDTWDCGEEEPLYYWTKERG